MLQCNYKLSEGRLPQYKVLGEVAGAQFYTDSRSKVLKVRSVDPFGSLRSFEGFMKQTIFIMMLKYYFSFFSYVKICNDGAKAMVSKTTGAFVSINMVVPKSSIAHCILHCLALVAFF